MANKCINNSLKLYHLSLTKKQRHEAASPILVCNTQHHSDSSARAKKTQKTTAWTDVTSTETAEETRLNRCYVKWNSGRKPTEQMLHQLKQRKKTDWTDVTSNEAEKKIRLSKCYSYYNHETNEQVTNDCRKRNWKSSLNYERGTEWGGIITVKVRDHKKERKATERKGREGKRQK
jgi:hypothetical protein